MRKNDDIFIPIPGTSAFTVHDNNSRCSHCRVVLRKVERLLGPRLGKKCPKCGKPLLGKNKNGDKIRYIVNVKYYLAQIEC